MEKSFVALKYGVGIDMGKDEFYTCVSAIDNSQRIKIKATRTFKNDPKGITDFYQWADHHCKGDGLPVHFLMEATGVYYEQLALFLHQKQAYVCVVLPQKAKHYIKALGIRPMESMPRHWQRWFVSSVLRLGNPSVKLCTDCGS